MATRKRTDPTAALTFVRGPRGRHRLRSTATPDSSPPLLTLRPMRARFGLSRKGFGGRDLRRGERATLALEVGRDAAAVRRLFAKLDKKARVCFEEPGSFLPTIRDGLLRVKVDVQQREFPPVGPGDYVRAKIRVLHTWQYKGRAGLLVVAEELTHAPPGRTSFKFPFRGTGLKPEEQ